MVGNRCAMTVWSRHICSVGHRSRVTWSRVPWVMVTWVTGHVGHLSSGSWVTWAMGHMGHGYMLWPRESTHWSRVSWVIDHGLRGSWAVINDPLTATLRKIRQW